MRWIFAIWIWIGAAAADPVVIFAAASLKEPLDRLAQGEDVVISYAGSGTLARQVLQGAPADVLLLANSAWMDEVSAGMTVFDAVGFAGNELVLIAVTGAEEVDFDTFSDRLGDGPLAMGFTLAVPAGIYGREALENMALWDQVSDRVAEVDNVRSVLALVARGEAPFGVVYATDAYATSAVSIVARFDPSSHAPIRYTGGALTEKGLAFWRRVLSTEGQDIFRASGFRAVPR